MKPQAKREKYAESSKQRKEFIEFWFVTENAKQWLIKEIPAFMEGGITGSDNGMPYGLRDKDTIPGNGWFVVNKCFDVQEVLDYINGDSE